VFNKITKHKKRGQGPALAVKATDNGDDKMLHSYFLNKYFISKIFQ
jgi:hypothetical protein